jgi:hypothetical protein
MGTVIRKGGAQDTRFLRDMLHHAYYWRARVPGSFVSRYVRGWGRPGDTAVIALYGNTSQFVHVDNGEVVPWSRLSEMMTSYFATVTSNPVSVTYPRSWLASATLVCTRSSRARDSARSALVSSLSQTSTRKR